ncbi:MAG: protein kinase [Sandaracinus sp.]|nr:protein kinase [Sandaracinus sp.]MCB9619646.1 protein kinase [Sandaracinus sp.]
MSVSGGPTSSLQAISPVTTGAGGLPSAYLGRYQLLAKLAAGGMATVYLGRIHAVAGFDRRVAIKVLHPHLSEDPNIRAMFLDEARLAARIRHPNVIPVTDVGEDPTHGTFLVMDYVEGMDLSQILRAAHKKNARVAVPVVVRIVSDTLAGLGAAHDLVGENGQNLGVVHRDVSPHNVLVGTDGIARITDFGIAKAEGRVSSTKTGQLKGKLAYMPPERFGKGGQRIDDLRGDLFATAVVLWESLTGRRLFKGEDDIDTVRKVLDAPIPKPSDVRPELAPLDAVTLKGLARDPDERYQTATEFRADLERAAAAVGGMARPEHVTSLMKAVLGPKLEQQRASVEVAVKLADDGGALPQSAPPYSASESSTTGTAIPARATSPVIWQVAVVGLLLVVVGLGAYLFGRGAPEAPPMTVIATPRQPAVASAPTESSAAEPSAGEPNAGEPSAAEPSGAEPSAAEPSGAEPHGEVGVANATDVAEANDEPAPSMTEPSTPAATAEPEPDARTRRRPRPVVPPTAPTVAEPTMAPSPPPPTMATMREDDVLENPYAQ